MPVPQKTADALLPAPTARFNIEAVGLPTSEATQLFTALSRKQRPWTCLVEHLTLHSRFRCRLAHEKKAFT